MEPGKKDLEIVYNLQWKNVSSHGDDRANIVGMYDIPATTLNWETFKSYLLKNSGATGDDVKVYYVSIDDKEFPIESQLDFQIALYSFRQRARNGDIITLKLDRISDQGRMGRVKRFRRSAELRMDEEKVQVISENNQAKLVVQDDGPPDWFRKYMKTLKKEIVEEVTTSVINHMSTIKTPSSTQYPCHHTRKPKVECCKRARKVPLVLNKPDTNDKELLKSLKLERKLDSKLEKLEQKTMKLKEKKLSHVRPNDDDTSSRNSSKSRPIGLPLSDTEVLMDASAVGHHELTIPHMFGGETYQQEWEVVNTGDMQWTENTELRYAWGSEALKPVERNVPCPKLKPGEKGTVVVYLEIPRKSGNYECYWHFYHDGRRFGHWLGCQVIVDPSPVKLPSPLKECSLDNSEKDLLSKSLTATNWSCTSKKLKTDQDLKLDPPGVDNNLKFCMLPKVDATDKPLNTSLELAKDKDANEEIRNMSTDLQGLKIYDTIVIPDSNTNSDSDNQSIVSIADSNSSMHSAPSDEFVVVPMPHITLDGKIHMKEREPEGRSLCIPLCSTIKLEKMDSLKSENSVVNNDGNGNNIEEPTVEEETGGSVGETKVSSKELQLVNKDESAYAYVTVDGQKIAVPKCLLRTDYLATAEDAPPPAVITSHTTMSIPTPVVTPKEETKQAILSTENNVITNPENVQGIVNDPIDPAVEKQEIQNSTITEGIYGSSECNTKSYHGSVDNSIHSNMDPLSDSTNNSNKSRLFVFPLNCPGFEVVYPPNPFVESLPPEVNESIESNQNTKAADGHAPPDYPYGVFYVNPPWPHHENLGTEYPLGYSWPKPESAYSYSPAANGPPQMGFKFEPNTKQTTNASEVNRSFQEAAANEAGAANTLHRRFGTYMRHRSPFNHAKHCSGIRCRQPLFNRYTSKVSTGPIEIGEDYSQYPNSAYSYQQKYWRYVSKTANPPGVPKPQSPPPPAASNEGQNSSPPPGNGDRSAVHILPDTLVSGAVNVASSAINTARSVLNMFSPPPRQEPVQWVSGIWTSGDPDSPRERALQTLSEMGFWDRNLNATLLARYNDDLARVIAELVQ